jgi:phosphoserine phosphatase RsbU/P
MKILIAEDERITQRNLQRQIEKLGHEVVAVDNGAEAWVILQEEAISMVITDWEMPEMNGLELIKHIRKSETELYTYVIILTGRSDTDDIVMGMEAGADDFISKPFDKNELRVRIRAGVRVTELERDLSVRNQELKYANQQIGIWKSRVQQEIELATDVQQHFLPQFDNVKLPIYAKNIPAVEISGDFFDVVTLDKNNIYFTLGDVAGKGIHAGMVMTQIVSLFRAYAINANSPSKIVGLLNDELVKTSVNGMFTTIVVGKINMLEKSVTFSNAGHIPPLIQDAKGEFVVTNTTSIPVGILSGSETEEFIENQYDLSEGAFYVFTDGVTEAKENNGNVLELEGIKKLIRLNADKNKQDRVNEIFSNIHLGKEDDITMMVIEFD